MIRKSYGSIIAKEIITEWNTEKYYKNLAKRNKERETKNQEKKRR